jgi:glycosyltransferase involved in cell wall biosynthesis
MTCDLVSVIIPARNAIKTIEGCLSSATRAMIRGKSPEIVVVDDGSDDGTAEFVASFAKRSSGGCVRMLRASGRGIASALNDGIAATAAPYIARLDADDEIHPRRLEEQLVFMAKNPECGALGTRALIGQSWESARRSHDHPTEVPSLRFALNLNNPFVHSSMLIRRKCLDDVGVYNDEFVLAEDYELWSRIARRWDVANLPSLYTLYRETHASASRAKANAVTLINLNVAISENNLKHTLGVPVLSAEHKRLVASFYGISKRDNTLLPTHAARLLFEVAAKIAGAPQGWSTEFTFVYMRTLRKLKLSCRIGRLSPHVLGLLRIVKQRGDRCGDYLLSRLSL